MNDSLESFRGEVLDRIQQANREADIEQLRVEVLGRSGSLTLRLRGLKDLPAEERPRAGQELNQLRQALEAELEERLRVVKERRQAQALQAERLDVTLPGTRWERGRLHPLTLVIDEIIDIFAGMGFEVARGPDIEDDYHNFEALNFPKDHPARDMQDTFFVAGDRLLRTHTSPVQIRTMESRQPPLQVIVPGAVYRHDDDATHAPMFHQVEGFMVDKNISFANLKGVLTHFLKQIFGRDLAVRFRPSFFPFTEPSAEIDIQCVICGGGGKMASGQSCRVCKTSGWLEILGAGMIDPNVFKFVGYDPENVSGFAFGMGVERIAMLKYGIDDIRLFFANDLRFLRQFG
ncbi:MAG: phenylalanine--tRNA ligase subunit alpha [Deltaproteobacteria bacterium]|nr:phenylalanine--tRNA ligase subunit alpha [Deltaproteobacteria bacterium]MBM4298623.1 phenylalanine--tRNA ligase subunit alpha [Deltaproteobacteria bacterium]